MYLNVQVLRAIAAMLVVWVHTQEMITSDQLPQWVRTFGYGGVDLFFVISGFIMVSTTAGKKIHPLTFCKRRFVRVAPLYYVFTLLVVIVGLTVPAALRSTQPDLIQTIKSLMFIPFEKTPDRLYPIYYLGWTLNYEMFFYAIFAPSLFLPRRAGLTVISLLMISLVLIGRHSSLNEAGAASFFYTRPILLDFVWGILVASYFRPWEPMRPSMVLPWWICLAAGSVYFVMGSQVFTFATGSVAPPTDTFLRFGVPAGLVLAGMVGLERSGIKVGNPLMRRAGDASYSLYLSHYFLVGSIIAVANRMDLDHLSRALLAPVTMSAALAVGFATYQLLERPLAGDFGIYHRS